MSIFADMLARIYSSPIGVSATLIVNDAGYDIGVVDLTEGIALGGDDLAVQTLSPAAAVRTGDLATVMSLPLSYLKSARFDLTGATLRLNGGEWRVTSHRHQPSPDGGGEILLLLEAAANPCSSI